MIRRTILSLVFLVFSGCAIMYTQQNVGNISMLEPGMSQSEVIQIMRTPAKTEFSGDKKAFHYCKTGYGDDEFAVVILDKGKVVAAKNYNVTLRDTGGASGDCSKFVKSVDINQADFVQEIRFR